MIRECDMIAINPFARRIEYVADDVVWGYLEFSLIYDRIEIDNLMVMSEYRGNGIGTKLMAYLVALVIVLRVVNITLEVRMSNEIAINLYKKFGFREVAIRRYYYGDENMSLVDAIEHAINRCIDEDVLKEFLVNRREEVAKVTNLDFTFERQIELEREEAENKGLLRGRETEIFKSVQEGDYGITRAAEKLGITETEFIEKMEKAGYKIPELL